MLDFVPHNTFKLFWQPTILNLCGTDVFQGAYVKHVFEFISGTKSNCLELTTASRWFVAKLITAAHSGAKCHCNALAASMSVLILLAPHF